MKQFIKQNWFKIGILSVILIAIYTYYSIEMTKFERDNVRETKLENCLIMSDDATARADCFKQFSK
jgi:uncharacterized membrane protein YdfJ with MMPL/SSD domain